LIAANIIGANGTYNISMMYPWLKKYCTNNENKPSNKNAFYLLLLFLILNVLAIEKLAVNVRAKYIPTLQKK